MVIKLTGFRSPRIVQFESKLEYDFLCLTAVRDDVHHIWDQPPAIQYVSADGQFKQHTFDFLIIMASGERIAVAIKPMTRVIKRNFITELEHVAAATPKQFADRVILVTDQHLNRHAAVKAARRLTLMRPNLTEVAA